MVQQGEPGEPGERTPAGRLSWRMRGLALYAAVRQAITGRHVYLSTGCLAGAHGYCKSMMGLQGQKRPGRAKFSDASCVCGCHR